MERECNYCRKSRKIFIGDKCILCYRGGTHGVKETKGQDYSQGMKLLNYAKNKGTNK